jgi:hypothetical protein
LTNSSIQKENLHASQLKANGIQDKLEGGTKISLACLIAMLKKQGVDWSSVRQRITTVILKTLVSVEDAICNQACSFELFGFDVLVDDNLQPWLIEVNASPSLATETPLDRAVKPQLVKDIIALVDPLPIDRRVVLKLLENRAKRGHWGQSNRGPQSKEEQKRTLNWALYKSLMGRVPRAYGETPAHLGNFQCIAPGKEFDHVMRLKRAAFKPQSEPCSTFRRALPTMV